MSRTSRDLLPYSENLPYTYAFGRFAVMEALKHRPQDVRQALWHEQLPAEHLATLLSTAEPAGVPTARDDATVRRLRRNDKVDCLAVVTKRPEVLAPHTDHVVLVNPSHPGNMGTVIRSMVAFGFHDLALIAPTVDPWGAYVVRASVGLRFAISCQVFSSLSGYLNSLTARRIYAFSADAAHELDEVRFERPLSLLFGPEWSSADAPSGPVAATQRHDVVRLRIPQSEQVESLNLATSVSIAAYRARK